MSTTTLVKEYAKYKRNVIKSRFHDMASGTPNEALDTIDKIEKCHKQGIITTDEAMRIISEI